MDAPIMAELTPGRIACSFRVGVPAAMTSVHKKLPVLLRKSSRGSESVTPFSAKKNYVPATP
jgi:hypothetical protein